jgi:hypothetical protein
LKAEASRPGALFVFITIYDHETHGRRVRLAVDPISETLSSHSYRPGGRFAAPAPRHLGMICTRMVTAKRDQVEEPIALLLGFCHSDPASSREP